MNRRLLAAVALAALTLAGTNAALCAADLYVSPSGCDAVPGTAAAPLLTLQHARNEARKLPRPVTIHLAGGTYYLTEPLRLTAEDSHVTWQAQPGETPVISGGLRLKLDWQPYKDGIMRAKVPDDLVTEQLFVNGVRQILARYPNFEPAAQYFDGFAADAASRERAARWADPRGGYLHAMHSAMWGGFSWRITGKDETGNVTLAGGWQNNRGRAANPKVRFVENIFEELDAPGEWFLDRQAHLLYYDPPAGVDLGTAVVEVSRLPALVELRGTQQQPVRGVALRGLAFRHAERTFMETREPLLRTDWAIYRGGAIFLEGTEDCLLDDLLIDQVGGNAVFVNHYNRRVTIRGSEIMAAGASGIVFLGDPQAARNPLFNYDQRQNLADIDRTPGPRSDNYPADCLVEDCLIHFTGRLEKQTAGVNIDLAQNIQVRHASIYDMPRAGINIGDGCWGGHVIEWCDVFDTVKETGDHGSFNSWGRDRYWRLGGLAMHDVLTGKDTKDLPVLDAVKPNILRNNRWRCDHGWDIDLDDGSSNYWIYNNLCLNGGIKNREGYLRINENNITVNNGFHAHVWFAGSHDIVRRNIFWRGYQGSPAKGQEIDYNLLHLPGLSAPRPATELQAESQMDQHSLAADALFVDPAHGDYRVREGSPALALGFQNFPMDQFGVTSPKLKARARTPELPGSMALAADKQATEPPGVWLGATVRAIGGTEFSIFGVRQEEGGVQLLAVPAGSPAARAGLRKDDLVQGLNAAKVSHVRDLVTAYSAAGQEPLEVRFVRDQKPHSLTLRGTPFVLLEPTAEPTAFHRLPVPAARSAAITANRKTANDPLATLSDGQLGQGYGPVFPNGLADGAYKIDLGSPQPVAAINSWSCNRLGRGHQCVELFGSNATTDPGWNTTDAQIFTPLGSLDTRTSRTERFLGASLRAPDRESLGTFRWIVWRVSPVTDRGENTAFQELFVETLPATGTPAAANNTR